MQIRTDPAALPKLNALIFKLRSAMLTPLAVLSLSPPSHPLPTPTLPPRSELGLEDSQAAAAEVVSYFTAGLLMLTQNVLQARLALCPPNPWLCLISSVSQTILSVVYQHSENSQSVHCAKQR